MPFRKGILFLILALMSPVAYAQQTSQQTTIPCYELYRNPSAGTAGALLLNKCTGKTWILIGTSPATWYPLSASNEEYKPPGPR